MSGHRNQERVNGHFRRVGLEIFREQRIDFLRRCPAQQLVQILRDGPVGKRGDTHVADLHAERAQVELSDWEGEFLGSVEDRVKTYGRAFGDPEKGGAGEALSVMQTVKLKEIAAKAKGEKKPFRRRPKPY